MQLWAECLWGALLSWGPLMPLTQSLALSAALLPASASALVLIPSFTMSSNFNFHSTQLKTPSVCPGPSLHGAPLPLSRAREGLGMQGPWHHSLPSLLWSVGKGLGVTGPLSAVRTSPSVPLPPHTAHTCPYHRRGCSCQGAPKFLDFRLLGSHSLGGSQASEEAREADGRGRIPSPHQRCHFIPAWLRWEHNLNSALPGPPAAPSHAQAVMPTPSVSGGWQQ